MKYPDSPRETPCTRGCCWTPTQVCAKRHTCTHHHEAYQAALSRRDQPTIRYASVEVQAA